MAGRTSTVFVVGAAFLCFISMGMGAAIPDQPGQEIVCTVGHFSYQHDLHQHGIDTNIRISGDAGFIAETHINPGAAFYTDAVSKNNTPAVFEYTFAAEPGKLLGDVEITSRGFILRNSGTITGQYRIGGEGGAWVTFLSFDGTGGIEDIRPVDVIENVHASLISIRYSLNRYGYDPWEADVQLFRSYGPLPNPGQPGDYGFTFAATVISDADAHRADLAGDDLFIDAADYTVLASGYGQSGPGAAGDIDGNGSCDFADLVWLISYWLSDC